MDTASPKNILSKYNIKPSKGLGQNFLVNKNILEKIIETSEINSTDTILEVGPGLGVLTKELAKRAGRVIAIEKDKKIIDILKESLAGFKNVEVINADALKYKVNLENFKVVANIPYYLTSPLIRKFLEGGRSQPKEMILMLQKEVAQRICSKPPRMSLLAVSVQFYADAKIVFNVPRSCFWPSPKVDSAIVKIIPFGRREASIDLFFKIVKAGFSQPRKQLVNNLTSLKNLNGVKLTKDKVSEWLLKNNIKPNQRSETLSVSDWIGLTKTFETF